MVSTTFFAQFIQVKENVNGRPHGYPTSVFMAFFYPIGSIPIKLRNYPKYYISMWSRQHSRNATESLPAIAALTTDSMMLSLA